MFKVGSTFKGNLLTLGVGPYSESPGLLIEQRTGFVTEDQLWSDALSLAYTCKPNVNERYVVSMDSSRVVPEFQQPAVAASVRDGCFVLYRATRRFYEPVAFIFAIMHKKSVHIDVICGQSGTGSFLLNTFLNYWDLRGVVVDLDSLASVLAYYPKFKFEFRNSCEEAPYAVPPDLQMRINAKVAARRVPKNNEEAYEDPDWLELMTHLTHKRLSAKGCKPGDDVVGNDCAEDGFRMFRCNAPIPKRERSPARASPRETPRSRDAPSSRIRLRRRAL